MELNPPPIRLRVIHREKFTVTSLHLILFDYFKQECINPEGQVAVATAVCTVAPNICRSSVWNLLLCQLSDTYNFEMASRFLENLHTPALLLLGL